MHTPVLSELNLLKYLFSCLIKDHPKIREKLAERSQQLLMDHFHKDIILGAKLLSTLVGEQNTAQTTC